MRGLGKAMLVVIPLVVAFTVGVLIYAQSTPDLLPPPPFAITDGVHELEPGSYRTDGRGYEPCTADGHVLDYPGELPYTSPRVITVDETPVRFTGGCRWFREPPTPATVWRCDQDMTNCRSETVWSN